MAYLLASLNILMYCTVYGDGIHIHIKPPPPPPPPPQSPLSLCINLLSTVRYCKFLCSVLLSVLLCPSPSYLPSVMSSSWIWQACGSAVEVHVVLTEDIHTELHTHSHIQAQLWHLYKTHVVVRVQNEDVGFNWQKCLDWANFYIYVPVYTSTTLWPWVVFSSAVLHYVPHKGKECSFIF